jgi:hypothetical protein
MNFKRYQIVHQLSHYDHVFLKNKMTHTCFCTAALLNAEVIWLPRPSVITSGLISGTRLAEEGLEGGGASGGFNGLICWTMTIPGVTVPNWPPLVVLTVPRPVPLDNARYDCDERTALTSFLGRPGPRPYIKIVKIYATLLTVQKKITLYLLLNGRLQAVPWDM